MDDAESVLRECLQRAQQLTAAFPENNQFTRLVADTWNALGPIYSSQGNLEAEKDAYQHAVEMHRSAYDRGSFVVIDALGVALSNLAITHRAGGEFEAAGAALEESLALFDEGERLAPGTPYRPTFRQSALITLAQVRADQGRYDEAALILRDLAAQEIADPRVLHGCAETWMWIAEVADGPLAGAAPREALEALRHALRLGYDDVDSLRANPSLEPLLADPTLEQLLRAARRP
jgi:tetratricopeptide (TPR) repeat protein